MIREEHIDCAIVNHFKYIINNHEINNEYNHYD